MSLIRLLKSYFKRPIEKLIRKMSIDRERDLFFILSAVSGERPSTNSTVLKDYFTSPYVPYSIEKGGMCLLKANYVNQYWGKFLACHFIDRYLTFDIRCSR